MASRLVDFTPVQWQLYSNAEGADKAASALNSALNKALQFLQRGLPALKTPRHLPVTNKDKINTVVLASFTKVSATGNAAVPAIGSRRPRTEVLRQAAPLQ